MWLDQSGNYSVKTVFNPFTDSLPMLSIIEGLIVLSVQVGTIIALVPDGNVLHSGVELCLVFLFVHEVLDTCN